MPEPTTRAERRAATAARILEAAQTEFGTHGTKATIRGIARRAGVDPSLVLQHYGSKDALFSLAVQPAAEIAEDEVAGHLHAVLDARLQELPDSTRALVRSMFTSEAAASLMRTYLDERVDALAASSDAEDAELRATIVVSSILGITIARHIVGLPGFDTDGDDAAADAAAVIEPWLTSLMTAGQVAPRADGSA